MKEPIKTTVQALIFLLIERADYFNGLVVSTDLQSHPNLWSAVMFKKSAAPGTELRDLDRSAMNFAIDTVLIRTTVGEVGELEKMVKRWRPDEIEIWDRSEAHDLMDYSHERVIRVWWD